MSHADHRRIDQLLGACSHELFSAYQLETKPSQEATFPFNDELASCAVMGFGGKLMRGSLVLMTTREPLQHTNPQGLGSDGDWVCELANQLMGRLKNRLLSLGVEILLATPAGLSGVNLSPTTPELRSPQLFSAADGFICVWIDFETSPGFELRSTPVASEEAPVAEGETILF
jgi:hypothetical protein